MTRVAGSTAKAASASGRLSKAITTLFMKRATVEAIDDIADRFRLVTFKGKTLQGVAWMPGQKIQIAMGSAFVARTYTPIEYDTDLGRIRILGYVHGKGPGSSWLRRLEIGDDCDLFGPRSSVDARNLSGPLAVFGDETSIGAAYALARQDRARSVRCYLEVGNVKSAHEAGAALDLREMTVFERLDDDTHLMNMKAVLSGLADAGASFVLTGKGGTVQRLRHDLKQRGVASSRVVTKAYWAPGKAGLD